eukprot:3192719-Rhodomonas_salina.1
MSGLDSLEQHSHRLGIPTQVPGTRVPVYQGTRVCIPGVPVLQLFCFPRLGQYKLVVVVAHSTQPCTKGATLEVLKLKIPRVPGYPGRNS